MRKPSAGTPLIRQRCHQSRADLFRAFTSVCATAHISSPPSDQAKDNQQHNCSYKSVNNQGNNAYTKMDI